MQMNHNYHVMILLKRKAVTNLWTSLSLKESVELAGGISPDFMEQHHKIQPTKKKIPANPAIYDPMKVTLPQNKLFHD